MNTATTIGLIALTIALLLDALRRRGALYRPEFYLYCFLWSYGTLGYVAYLTIHESMFQFMLTYDVSTIDEAYVHTTLALVGVYLGGGLYRARPFPPVALRPALSHVALAGGLLALAVNFAFFYEQGLLSGTLNHTDLIEAKAAGFFFPYGTLMIVSIPMLALYERGRLAWLLFGGFAVVNLAGGSRRHVLLAFVALFVARLLKGVRYSKRWLGAVLLVGLVVGTVVGATRGRTELNELDGLRAVRVFSEFFRPFGTLLHYVDRREGASLEGQSFLDGGLMLIPSPISPVKRPVSLGEQFKTLIDSMGVYEGERVPGYGFSPVTEIFLNFGAAGVPVFFFFFALVVRSVSSVVVRNEWAFMNGFLCAAMFTIARGGFQNVMGFVFQGTVMAFFMIALAQLVGSARGTVIWRPSEAVGEVTSARPS